ncbi:MAG: RluA family pseudouridine synthase [Acidobacteriota bacterium]|nr:RluA family pseudouridine synthase [Acidobacteriota bacterium]
MKEVLAENEVQSFSVESADANKRLDAFLAEKVENWSRSRLQQLIDDGDVLVNGKTAKSSYKVKTADEIEVELVAPEPESFTPENIPLNIVFEDEEIAVINKAAGMVVHPGAGVSSGTLANAIAYHFKLEAENTNNRVGIVHRLDKDTSGLIVVAKTQTAHENLSNQFRAREVFKSYVALVHGEMPENSGKIDAPIARDRNHRLRMSVQKAGRNALTLWKVRERFERFTLLNVEIKTGRTHQIRVHLAWSKHPVVGDELYNAGRDKTVKDAKTKKEIELLNRFFLHAERLGFRHPMTNEWLGFQAVLPPELENFLKILEVHG